MGDVVTVVVIGLLAAFALVIVLLDNKMMRGAVSDLEHPDGCVCETCEDRVWRRMIERAEADKRRREMQAAVDELVRDTKAERR